MLDWLHHPYVTSWLQMPLLLLGLSTLGFLLPASAFTWLAWNDTQRLRPWKIQAGSLRPEVERHWRAALLNFLRNQLILTLLLMAAWPLLHTFASARLQHQAALPVWLFVVQLLAVALIDDFAYYWFHRLMHVPRLLKLSHYLHHKPRHVFALQGNYMTWWEFALTSLLVVSLPTLLGMHFLVLCSWVFLRQVGAAIEHSGYQLPWNPMHLMPFTAGEAYHDFHHSRYTGNYAHYTALWDHLFGTFSRDYPLFVQQWKANGNRHPAYPVDKKTAHTEAAQ